MRLILNQASPYNLLSRMPRIVVCAAHRALSRITSTDFLTCGCFISPMNLYQAMIEQTADAFIFSDSEGRIQLWNHGAELVFGFSAKDAIGQSLDIIIPEHLRQAHWIGFHKAVAAGRMSLSDQVMTTRFLHKDGSKGYVDMHFSLLKDSTDRLMGVLATARDSTARYLAERTLRARLAELAPADESKPAPAATNK